MNEYRSDHNTPEVTGDGLAAASRLDKNAFEALYLHYVKPVYRYLFSRLGDRSDAEDATAQTFLSLLEGIDRYREDGHFSAWLFSVARRKAADHFRQATRSSFLPDDLPAFEDDLLQQTHQRERRKKLQELLGTLTDDEQELLRLRFAAGLAYAEIARVLERKEDAVKKSLYRLLEKMQNRMEENHD